MRVNPKAILVGAALVLAACGGNGKPNPNSISARQTANAPVVATATPSLTMTVAQAAPVAESAQAASGPYDFAPLVALGVIFGVPMFWALKLRFFQAARRTSGRTA